MHHHALDAVPERDRARVAGSAGAAEFQEHLAVLEAAKLNVSSVLLDRGPDSRLEELVDHAHHLAVLVAILDVAALAARLTGRGARRVVLDRVDELLARRDRLGDEAEDLGLDVGPVGVARLDDGDEVRPVEDRAGAVDVQQPCGQRRRVWRGKGRAWREVLEERSREAFGQNPDVGDELESLYRS